MVFTPIVKVRNPKQRENAKRKEAKIAQNAQENAARKAKRDQRAQADKSPDLSEEELSKRDKRQIKERHRQRILDEVEKGAICVEIGVWRGNFSQMILDTVKPLNLALIDPWEHFEEDDKAEAFAGQTKNERFEEIYQEVCQKYAKQIDDGQVTIMRERSSTAIARYSNDTIDFAYIDGDHSYAGVKADLNDIFPKMKNDGIIVFDDYHRLGWWGDDVLRAIHEFIGQHPTEIRVFMVEGTQIALTKQGPIENAGT